MRDKLFSRDEILRQEIDTLKRRLRAKLGGYVVAIREAVAGNLFYRGVHCDVLPLTISRISFPPSAMVTKLGRLNRVGTSMFYCTLGEPPVFYELRAKPGDRVALSEWELTEPLWMHSLGFHDDALRQIGTPIAGRRARMTNPIPNESRFNHALRRKLSLAMAAEVSETDLRYYKLTIAINELLFDSATSIPITGGGPRHDRAAGTVYPSLQMRGRADNVALLPEFVKSSLRIKSVKYVLVESVDEAQAQYSVRTLRNASTFDGDTIVWGEQLPDEDTRRHSVT